MNRSFGYIIIYISVDIESTFELGGFFVIFMGTNNTDFRHYISPWTERLITDLFLPPSSNRSAVERFPSTSVQVNFYRFRAFEPLQRNVSTSVFGAVIYLYHPSTILRTRHFARIVSTPVSFTQIYLRSGWFSCQIRGLRPHHISFLPPPDKKRCCVFQRFFFLWQCSYRI